YKYNVNSAKRAQEEQLKYIKERVELIRNDKTLVNIPFGLRTKVFKILESGLHYTQRNYFERLAHKFA
ncbi:MAG: hypothetical protein ACTSU9_04435, partial [Promethearchaeota archaeon]